jgi:hypothetical protein
MNTDRLGMGVMLCMLGGNEETVNAVKESLGKKINRVWLDEENDTLRFELEDGSNLTLWDGGQSCCENRYMRTDDDLNEYCGSTLLDLELKSGPDQEDEYGECHEIQFLDVKTDKGIFQMANHNEHNGYYGGFWVQASKG